MENMSDLLNALENELINPVKKVSKGTESQRTTVKNHFKKYVKFLEERGGVFQYFTLEDLCAHSPQTFTDDFVGKFVDYIYKKANLTSSLTMDSYISQFKAMLLDNGMTSDHHLFKSEYFGKLSKKLRQTYFADGYTRDEAPSMEIEDLTTFCRFLIEKNEYFGLMDRALLCVQWQMIGRISEAVILKTTDLKMAGEILRIHIGRSKTTVAQTLVVFPHPNDFYACPFHALASWILVSKAEGKLFPSSKVTEEGACKYTNNLLRELTAEAMEKEIRVTRDMTSHSTRTGASTYLHMRSDICNDLDIERRGGWSVNAKASARYFRTTNRADVLLGKVLSGWDDIYLDPKKDHGGKVVSIESLPFDDGIRTYVLHLFGTTDLDQELKEKFCLVLLLHYNHFKALFPRHILCVCMESTVSESVLKDWSDKVMDRYKQINKLSKPESSAFSAESPEVLQPILQPILQNQLQLSAQYDHQEKMLLQLGCLMKDMKDTQKELIERMNMGIPCVAPQPSGTPPRPVVIPEMFFPKPRQEPTHKLPEAKSLDAAKLFLLWFDSELHKYEIRKEHPQYELMEAYKQVVAHSKCFLDPGTIIIPKPTNPDELKLWQEQIVSWSKKISARWTDLKQNHDGTNGKITVWSIKRLLPTIKAHEPLLFDFSKVSDTATSANMKWEIEKHRTFKKKRIEE
jgi:hypothetical protein